jgi:hypothetical protein
VASRERAVAVVARPRSGGSQLLGGMQRRVRETAGRRAVLQTDPVAHSAILQMGNSFTAGVSLMLNF